jgi:hypothetical protein
VPDAPSPILDDQNALHAQDPAQDQTICDLPEGAVRAVHAVTLDDAQTAGVNCLICLGWLGAQLTDPPVVIKGSWYPYGPPMLKGESVEAFTDRLSGADRTNRIPFDHQRNRQCSLGWHNECSDPDGDRCECPCHRPEHEAAVITVGDTHMILMPPDDEESAPSGDWLEQVPDEPPTPEYDGSKVMGIAADVAIELRKAMRKFPGQHLPLGFGKDADGWIPGVSPYSAADVRDMFRNLTDHAADCGRLTWRHVLTEEQFEAFAEDDTAKARTELVQLAAMAFRAILDIDHPAPIHYTGPSHVVWDQVGTDDEGNPVLARHVNGDVNGALTPSGAATGAATTPPGDTHG